MNDDISEYIISIEEELDIDIIGVWDTGSRAWGLSHDDSDYDLSILFIHSDRKSYAVPPLYKESIDSDEDTVNPPESISIASEMLDFEGWNSREFYSMVATSNPAALETILSPVRYRTNESLNDLSRYVRRTFSVPRAIIHFRSVAKRNYRKYLKNRNKSNTRKNLFTIRAALYAEYIRETKKYPAPDFFEFLSSLPEEVKTFWDIEQIRELAEKRTSGINETISPVEENNIKRVFNKPKETAENYLREDTERLDKSRVGELLEKSIEKA